MKKSKKAQDLYSAATPIDRVAARVMPKKKELPEEKILRDRAAKTKNPKKIILTNK